MANGDEPVPSFIIPETLRYLLDRGSTLALIDVREHGEYNAAHIPGASSLPRRLIEFHLGRLVPCPAVQIVAVGDDGDRGQCISCLLRRGRIPRMQRPRTPERLYHDVLNYLRWEEALGRKYQAQSSRFEVQSS